MLDKRQRFQQSSLHDTRKFKFLLLLVVARFYFSFVRDSFVTDSMMKKYISARELRFCWLYNEACIIHARKVHLKVYAN